MHLSQVRRLLFSVCRLLMWFICVSCFFFSIKIRPLVFLFELFTLVIVGPFIAWCSVWAKGRLRVEGRSLTYYCLLFIIYIVIWIESCLIGTHTTSSYLYGYTYLSVALFFSSRYQVLILKRKNGPSSKIWILYCKFRNYCDVFIIRKLRQSFKRNN